MAKKGRIVLLWVLVFFLLTGCSATTIDELYSPPRRSAEFEQLQNIMDSAMVGLEYCAPLTGENRQTVQMADLNGDGEEEYLLFAKGTDGKPLKILIFTVEEEGYRLWEQIESNGSAFEQVEYVNMDGGPGLELVVGRQLSDQVLRSVSVYRFSDESAELLMKTNYDKFITSDLNDDRCTDLTVIKPGQAETDKATAVMFAAKGGTVERSAEAMLSAPAGQIKRIMTGNLLDGSHAVYVASALDEQAIITDVFAVRNGRFTNISFSSESGTSVQTLRNYYVYADDIDQDDVLEFPSLITMVPMEGAFGRDKQHLIRWYAIDIQGQETDKMFTFHNVADGWYVELDSTWAERVSVVASGGAYRFYVWDPDFQKPELLMTIFLLTGADRESQVNTEGRFLLHRGDELLYGASVEDCAASYGITRENLADNFHLIFKDWKTGET